MMRTANLLLPDLGILLYSAKATGEPPKVHKTSPTRNESLRQELLAMTKINQELRNEAIKAGPRDVVVWKKVEAIDRKNTARLKEIVATYGWPGNSLVGKDG